MSDLGHVVEVLKALPAVQLAVAFGSVARGEDHLRSDLDLGLLLDPDSRQCRGEVEIPIGRAARRRVDFVYLDEAPPLLRFEVARAGQVLLERRPRLWTRFKAKAMIDWWDWGPTARKMHAVYIQRLRERVANGQP